MKNSNFQVCVIGLGYVGLPTAAMLAIKGVRVFGVEINPVIISNIKKGIITVLEEDFECVFKEALNSGNLIVSDIPKVADAFIICVPTPLGEDLTPNIEYVQNAVDSISKYVKTSTLVVIESTCPIGTTERMCERLYTQRPDLRQNGSVLFAYCPERVLPGNIVNELTYNERIIGGLCAEASKRAKALFSTFCKGKIHLTDTRTAEMVKLVENAYRCVNIAFANEVSMICDKENIDVKALIDLANEHPRVNILDPGIGVGGHCIPVDPYFLSNKSSYRSRFIEASLEVNRDKTRWISEQIIFSVRKHKISSIVCFGITYKENVKDLRNSPAIEIINRLAKELTVYAVDPYFEIKPNELSKEVIFTKYENALKNSYYGILLVKHNSFNFIDNSLKLGQVFKFSGVKNTAI